MRRLILAAITLLLTVAAHAAAPPPQWLPHESWPGGKQYDPRLERTVTFWGTGVPAAEAFASITKQTGVALAFSPPDDDNARICLNVYLNPKEPPTLRDLLAQIGWVMDCAWAVEGEGEARRYVLLHTSMGDNMLETLEARRRAEMDNAHASREQREADLRAKMLVRLAEVREAMALSRDQLIARYRGRDDLLLLAMLDPKRRTVCRFLLTLSESDISGQGPGRGKPWSQLTSQQRAMLREALTPQLRRWAAETAHPDEHWDDWQWLESLEPTVEITDFGTGYWVIVEFDSTGGSGGIGSELGEVILLDCPYRSPTLARTRCRTDLRRALGEEVSPEEEERLYREEEQRWTEAWERAKLEEVRAATLRLSPEAAAKLSALSLPVRWDAPYALWQLQEAVAAASGMHVISDALWQPERPFQKALDVLFPEARPDPTALQVMIAACMSTSFDSALPDARDPDIPGWEWGDAGSILRFRSAQRDVWRASFLPRAMLQALDAPIEPYLKGSPEKDSSSGPIAVPLDPRGYSRLLLSLDVFQARYGGRLLYGDPTDQANAYRHAFREEVLDHLGGQRNVVRLLVSVTDEQWERLRGEGLVWGRDLFIPLNREDLPFGIWGYEDGWLLRVVPTDQADMAQEGVEDGPRPEPGVEGLYLILSTQQSAQEEGELHSVGFHEFIPTKLTLQPETARHLLPPPEGAAPPD